MRSENPGYAFYSEHPIYTIPKRFPGVKAMFSNALEHRSYDDGDMHVYITTLGPETSIDDLDALEAGYNYLEDFIPEYTPTPEEVMRALRGPMGEPGPMGPKGERGDSGQLPAHEQKLHNPYANPYADPAPTGQATTCGNCQPLHCEAQRHPNIKEVILGNVITVSHPRTKTIDTMTRSSFETELVGLFPAMTEAAYSGICTIQRYLNANTPAMDSLAVRRAESLGLIITTT